jgi:enterochelin esterase-like enzyme/sugar lactone lactonase YvrE
MLRFLRSGLLAAISVTQLCRGDDYVLGPDSQRQPGVPEGVVTQQVLASSKLYPGTTRDYWIYVPAQYKSDKPACLMVFQDGGGFVSPTGSWRVPIVFDNLISKGEMPVTIGIFVNPGIMPAASPSTAQGRYNRSYEYDALGGRYAQFLIEEILPEIGKRYNISKDPNDRAIAGSSSGGIAAFNAAWNRPDAFHRVVSFIGSFTNLRGGDTLASRIRKTEPKPLRVFLQDGRNDQDIYSGNWFLGNQEIFSALQYAGYESEFVIGTEGHNGKHGGAILPDALRWIWKDYPKPVAVAAKINDRGVYAILEPGSDWQLLGQGYQLTADSTVDRQGNVYFTDHHNNHIDKIDLEGKITIWKEDSGGSHGIAFGPDGRLYAGQHDRKRIVAFSLDGQETVVAEGMQTHHLTVTARNDIYFADAPNHRVWMVDAKGNKRLVLDGIIVWPRGVQVSTDQSLLVVNDPHTRWVTSFQIQPNGFLTNGQAFYHLETPDEASETESASMAFDTEGFLYVGTNLGVQVCDQPGRVNMIINPPAGSDAVGTVLFGGADRQWLYVSDGERMFRRHLKRKGAESWNPTKPPQPHL